MEKPVVSVIMPAYNCEKFIAKAIESVLVQNVSLELIILNDCATDGTERVIQQYLSDQRIRYVKNDRNMGWPGREMRGYVWQWVSTLHFWIPMTGGRGRN